MRRLRHVLALLLLAALPSSAFAAGTIVYQGGTGTQIWPYAATFSGLLTAQAGLTVSGGVLLAPNGTLASPAYSFGNDSNTGFYLNTVDTDIGITINGTRRYAFNASGFFLLSDTGNFNLGVLGDLVLQRDAANTLAQRNGTNAQESRVYATYTSASQRHYMAMKTAKTTLSAVSGASVTATALIPKGVFVVGVTTRVNTGLGVTNGTTGYQVGDGTDADRWGAITGTAAGTDSDNVDATANPTGAFTAANDVVITATGGNFDGTGVIEVAVMYLTTNAD